MIDLLVGLGNPGIKYLKTRHNIGQRFLEDCLGGHSFQNKFKGRYGKVEIAGQSMLGLIPSTFMNLSGESVLACSQFYKMEPEKILVIHDELDLEWGRIQVRQGGGLAGHNGLKSIAKCLGSQNFYRLRVGISRPPFGDVASWVLSDFTMEEEIQVSEIFKRMQAALDSLLMEGLSKCMERFNKKI